MVKGWKNNPAWVAYYADKKEKQRQRRIASMQAHYLIEAQNAACEASLRRAEMALMQGRMKP